MVKRRSESHERWDGVNRGRQPKSEDTEEFSPQAIKALTLIAKELPLKKAAAIVAELYGYKKNALYQFGLDNLD